MNSGRMPGFSARWATARGPVSRRRRGADHRRGRPHVGGPEVRRGRKGVLPAARLPFDLKTAVCDEQAGTVECFQTKVEDGVVFVRTQNNF